MPLFVEDQSKPPRRNLRRFILAAGVKLEVPFQKQKGRGLCQKRNCQVYLEPLKSSREVLKLYQGEIANVSGRYGEGANLWLRVEFGDSQLDAGFVTSQQHHARIGWIQNAEFELMSIPYNESSIKAQDIPTRSRNLFAFNEAGRPTKPKPEFDPYNYEKNLKRWNQPEHETSTEFIAEERNLLSKQGFYAVPLSPQKIDVDDFADLYNAENTCWTWDRLPESCLPVFISSDLYLHSFHLVFDRMLQELEVKKWTPLLKETLSLLYAANQKLYEESASSAFKEAAKVNLWYTGTALSLFGNTPALPTEIKAEVEAEVDRIRAAKAVASSPLLPKFRDDYTQYKPRGHYTINEELKKYFIVMSVLGRKHFALSDERATRAALLLTKQLEGHKAWTQLSGALDFLIGRSDNWTPTQYAKEINKVYGAKTNIAVLENAKSLASFQKQAALDLPASEITNQGQKKDHESHAEQKKDEQGFKLLGQRWTLDASLINLLTYPSVSDDVHPKNLPSVLEIMALLGSKTALKEIPQSWFNDIKNYGDQFKKAQTKVSSFKGWRANVYSLWLGTLASLFEPSKSKQFFAQSPAWGYKALNTASGSYTELKHDTILYGKQGAAEAGGGGELTDAAPYAPPPPKSYVEPHPEFFARLTTIADLILQLGDSHNALTDEYKNKFLKLKSHTEKLRRWADKEVRGLEFTPEDYNEMLNLPFELDRPLLFPAELAGDYGGIPEHLKQAALVADIGTDLRNGTVAMTGVAYPQALYVLVKDYWGGTRITRGVTYTYVEWQDQKRWSDDEWKKEVYQSNFKPVRSKIPSWSSQFMKRNR